MYNADVFSERNAPKRILAVDWGSKRLGLAVSDASRLLARPLCVIEHVSHRKNAERILEIANENRVQKILVGVTYTPENTPTYSGRSAMRLLQAIADIGEISVIPWDEEGTTKEAKRSSIQLGGSRRKRKGHLDSSAAAHILQDYLDSEKRT